RDHPDLFAAEVPTDPPWDPADGTTASLPLPAMSHTDSGKEAPARSRKALPVNVAARMLQGSAVRRIWTQLFDFRDWVSYVYVPIIIPLLFVTPFLAVRYYEHARRVEALTESISQGSPDLDVISRLLDGPVLPWTGEVAEEVSQLDQRSFQGF